MKYFVLLSRMVVLFQCDICVTYRLAEERIACNCITEKLGSTKGYMMFVARLGVCSVDVKCLQFLQNIPMNLVTNHLVIKYPLCDTMADFMRAKPPTTDFSSELVESFYSFVSFSKIFITVRYLVIFFIRLISFELLFIVLSH